MRAGRLFPPRVGIRGPPISRIGRGAAGPPLSRRGWARRSGDPRPREPAVSARPASPAGPHGGTVSRMSWRRPAGTRCS